MSYIEPFLTIPASFENPFSPLSNKADFRINALDMLSGSQDLIQLRSRGFSVRPFYKIVDLRNAAEEKFRDTERQLSEKLQALQKNGGKHTQQCCSEVR